MRWSKRKFMLGAGASLALPALAQGVGDEIRIGCTNPLSGPAAAYGAAGMAMEAHFAMVNEAGGIHGRRIRLLVADDGFSPPRTLEQTRRLVEGEKVVFMLGQVGTNTALAARQYLNDAKVPQLFIASGAPTWLDDIDKYPWSLALQPSYVDEGLEIAAHILATRPNAKVGALFQNDDAGRGFMRGLREGLARRPGVLVKEQTTEATEPTVDSQVIALNAAGADTVVIFMLPRSTSQAIRRVHDLQWSAQIYLSSASTSIAQALLPAGPLERSKGILSVGYMKDPTDPGWAGDEGVRSTIAMTRKYRPRTVIEFSAAVGVTMAQLGTEVLRLCGKDPSRDNILAQTMRLDIATPMLLPGLRVKTSPTRRAVLNKVRLQVFDGASWKLM